MGGLDLGLRRLGIDLLRRKRASRSRLDTEAKNTFVRGGRRSLRGSGLQVVPGSGPRETLQ